MRVHYTVFVILLLLLPIAVAQSPTGNAVALPDEVPNIISQTAQKDKAAIVLINSIVSGTVVLPSFDAVEIIDSDIVGQWTSEFDDLVYWLDGIWTITTAGGTVGGFYETDNNIVTMYTSNGQFVAQAEYYLSVDGQLVLTDTYDPSSWQAYSYIGPAGDESIEAIANNFVLVRDTSITGEIISEEIETGVRGTGFIVSSDGFIVTNAHVVLADQDPERMLTEEFTYLVIDKIYSEFASSYNLGEQDREILADSLIQKTLDYFAEYGQITNIQTDFNVINGVASPGEDLALRSWPAEVRKQGEVYRVIDGDVTWGKDVALLKVQKTNLPTVTLGNSDQLQPGDTVFVIGYPGAADDPIFEPSERLEPTVTQGVISAKKTLRTGVESIQTDASILGGNSGGPAYNNRGEVVGIATFGITEGSGVNFLLPINLAKEFMRELNVANTPSQVDAIYDQGLEAFWVKDCYTANEKLRSTLALYPGHPYVQDYITECERAILAGEIKKPLNLQLIFGIIIVLAIIAILVILLLRKNKINAPVNNKRTLKK